MFLKRVIIWLPSLISTNPCVRSQGRREEQKKPAEAIRGPKKDLTRSLSLVNPLLW